MEIAPPKTKPFGVKGINYAKNAPMVCSRRIGRRGGWNRHEEEVEGRDVFLNMFNGGSFIIRLDVELWEVAPQNSQY